MKKKFETMMTFHVRFDINNENLAYGSAIADRIREAVTQYINHGITEDTKSDFIYFQPASTFTMNGRELAEMDESTGVDNTKAKITFCAVVDQVTDEASANRHTPNVWRIGGLRNMRQAIRAYTANRVFAKSHPLASRVKPFDATDGNAIYGESDYYTLPSLPIKTMELAVQRMRHKESRQVNEVINEQLTEEVLDILEGLFEDGLPANYEMTARESRVSSPEPF